MNTQYIKELLDKYFEAETSLQEEKELKSYFNSGHPIDPRFNGVATLFKVLEAESNVSAKVDFQSKLENIPLRPISQTTSGGGAKMISMQKYFKMAAAVVVLALASVFVVKYTLNNQSAKDSKIEIANYIEVTDPDEAMAYTEDALKILAKVFKTSQNGMDAGMKAIDETPVIGSRQ